MTPEEFKKYFNARRRLNSLREQGAESGNKAASYAAEPCKTVKMQGPGRAVGVLPESLRNGRENEAAVKKIHSEAPAGKADIIVKSLQVITKNNNIVNKTIKTAEEWLAVDKRELRAEGNKRKIPLSTMLMIFTVSFALLLIVAGTVITSKASMELLSMKNQLSELTSYKYELEQKIEIKNDLKYIEMVARTKLGMVDREYAAAKYIGGGAEDKVVIYDTGDDNDKGIDLGLSTLLSALGFPD